MAITANSVLSFNAFDRIIVYRGVQKQFNDDFWETHIVPVIRPLWDSERDRLELFIYRENGNHLVQRSKFKRNHSTGESRWVSYEFDPQGMPDYTVDELFNSLKEKFLDYKDLSEAEYERAVRRKIEEVNVLNWEKLKLVRKFLLDDCDWTQLPDTSITDEQKTLWCLYRSWIRDNPISDINGNDAETPYDVVLPITPTEYLKRKEYTLDQYTIDKYGDQGVNSEYLTSEYHFWKLSSNSLKYFAQKMSVYLILNTLTRDSGSEGFKRIDIKKFHTAVSDGGTPMGEQYNDGQPITNETIEEKGQAWLDDLIGRIEAGEI